MALTAGYVSYIKIGMSPPDLGEFCFVGMDNGELLYLWWLPFFQQPHAYQRILKLSLLKDALVRHLPVEIFHEDDSPVIQTVTVNYA
jgi:hypothetical protein